MTVLVDRTDRLAGSGAQVAHDTVNRLWDAGCSWASASRATGVRVPRLRAIRSAAHAATIDEACRIVGFAGFLDQLTRESEFVDLTATIGWADTALVPSEGCYLRPFDLLATNDLELVEDLARARKDSRLVAELLGALGREWRSEVEVFTDDDGRGIRVRA